MKNHSACPGVEILEQYAVGRTSDDEAQRLEEHLGSCARCVARLPSLGDSDGLLQSLRAQKDKPRPGGAIIEDLQERLRGLRPPGTTVVYSETSSLGLEVTPSTSDNSLGTEEDARALLAPPQGPDEMGRLGPYRVLRVLGAGGMGVVFEAEDPQLKRRVALKALRPALAIGGDARQRFLREAQRMASLTHDHILTIHHVAEDRAVPFLVMPLLQGESLEDRLRREGQLPVAEVLRIGRETALGLAAAHALGVIHRDVKPSNLWLEAPSGRVKILDFGLARLAEGDAALTRSGALVGTPAYMAPEQAEGAVDRRADLFSLGCVLYRMVTGQLAFPGRTPVAALRAVATLNPTPARQINPAVPEPLSQLIERLLSKDPAGRPASAGDVVHALAKIGEAAVVPESSHAVEAHGESARVSGTASAPVPSPLPGLLTATPPARRRRWLQLSAAGLLAGALALPTLALWHGRSETTGGASVPDKLQVLSLDVKHFARVKGQRDPRFRLLGDKSFVTHCEDTVEVAAGLSRPAYAFLIAFRSDGTVDVCFPEKDDEAPPRTDRPCYPSVSKGNDYLLDNGAGLEAFALVASSQPLPSSKEWWSAAGCPWRKSDAPTDVVWRSLDGVEVEPLTPDPAGSRGRHEVLGKASVVRLMDWLWKQPGVEAVAVLGFAVKPKDQP
jgi:serine/threonine protein kinase